jgi:hypothetical protein
MAASKLAIERVALITALRHLETIVVSLDRIGSCGAELGEQEYKDLVVEFLNDWNVFEKLAETRKILSTPFSTALGDDGMDELEREFDGLQYWSRKE